MITQTMLIPFVLIYLKAFISIVNSQGHFIKDQRLDHNFPPAILKASKGVPIGHLRPLGYQIAADSQIKSHRPPVNLDEIHKNFFFNKKPFVIRSIYSSTSPNIWGDKMLSKRFGNYEFRIQMKQLRNGWEEKSIKLTEFLKKYHYEEWKLRSPIYEEMKNELTIPSVFQCATVENDLQYVSLWLSSGPSSSNLFYDGDDQLHCFLSGRGDFIVINQQYRQNFTFKERPYEHSDSGESQQDMDQINLFEYEEISRIPWNWATLSIGDCIYVPSGKLQQIRTYGQSVSIIFSIAPKIEYYDHCNKTENVNGTNRLSNMKMMWSFDGKFLVPTVEKWTAEILKVYMHAMIGNRDKLHFKKFAELFVNSSNKTDQETKDILAAFKEFSLSDEDYILQEEIDTDNLELFQRLADMLEKRHDFVIQKEEL